MPAPRNTKKTTAASEPPSTTPPASLVETSQEEIARRAYEIYLRRGGSNGHDLDDWLQAERELRSEIGL